MNDVDLYFNYLINFIIKKKNNFLDKIVDFISNIKDVNLRRNILLNIPIEMTHFDNKIREDMTCFCLNNIKNKKYKNSYFQYLSKNNYNWNWWTNENINIFIHKINIFLNQPIQESINVVDKLLENVENDKNQSKKESAIDYWNVKSAIDYWNAGRIWKVKDDNDGNFSIFLEWLNSMSKLLANDLPMIMAENKNRAFSLIALFRPESETVIQSIEYLINENISNNIQDNNYRLQHLLLISRYIENNETASGWRIFDNTNETPNRQLHNYIKELIQNNFDNAHQLEPSTFVDLLTVFEATNVRLVQCGPLPQLRFDTKSQEYVEVANSPPYILPNISEITAKESISICNRLDSVTKRFHPVYIIPINPHGISNNAVNQLFKWLNNPVSVSNRQLTTLLNMVNQNLLYLRPYRVEDGNKISYFWGSCPNSYISSNEYFIKNIHILLGKCLKNKISSKKDILYAKRLSDIIQSGRYGETVGEYETINYYLNRVVSKKLKDNSMEETFLNWWKFNDWKFVKADILSPMSAIDILENDLEKLTDFVHSMITWVSTGELVVNPMEYKTFKNKTNVPMMDNYFYSETVCSIVKGLARILRTVIHIEPTSDGKGANLKTSDEFEALGVEDRRKIIEILLAVTNVVKLNEWSTAPLWGFLCKLDKNDESVEQSDNISNVEIKEDVSRIALTKLLKNNDIDEEKLTSQWSFPTELINFKLNEENTLIDMALQLAYADITDVSLVDDSLLFQSKTALFVKEKIKSSFDYLFAFFSLPTVSVISPTQQYLIPHNISINNVLDNNIETDSYLKDILFLSLINMKFDININTPIKGENNWITQTSAARWGSLVNIDVKVSLPDEAWSKNLVTTKQGVQMNSRRRLEKQIITALTNDGVIWFEDIKEDIKKIFKDHKENLQKRQLYVEMLLAERLLASR
eukprot:GHVL01039432.1.p1 GENE.GHVL01039432.1~~GHVL01039432.1.p1  ORF type:complete len:979 (+),score=289.16 GHVL01039432.1:165-2939(+)